MMFSYLDGFVTICSQVDAMEVVNLVNNMFISFDKLTEQHDVYKVKIISKITDGSTKNMSSFEDKGFNPSSYRRVRDCNLSARDSAHLSHFEVDYQRRSTLILAL